MAAPGEATSPAHVCFAGTVSTLRQHDRPAPSPRTLRRQPAGPRAKIGGRRPKHRVTRPSPSNRTHAVGQRRVYFPPQQTFARTRTQVSAVRGWPGRPAGQSAPTRVRAKPEPRQRPSTTRSGRAESVALPRREIDPAGRSAQHAGRFRAEPWRWRPSRTAPR